MTEGGPAPGQVRLPMPSSGDTSTYPSIDLESGPSPTLGTQMPGHSWHIRLIFWHFLPQALVIPVTVIPLFDVLPGSFEQKCNYGNGKR